MPQMCRRWEEREMLANEKEVLGFYLTSHPLAEYEDQPCPLLFPQDFAVSAARKDRDRVSMGGMISAVKHSHVKNRARCEFTRPNT